MPGDNFGDNNFLWGQNLLNAVSSYASAFPIQELVF